jgi:hypothetical protein
MIQASAYCAREEPRQWADMLGLRYITATLLQQTRYRYVTFYRLSMILLTSVGTGDSIKLSQEMFGYFMIGLL